MKPRSARWRRLGLALLALGLLAALAWVALRAGPLAPIRVTVSPATQGSLSPALFGIGTVEARRSYLIGPTSAGRVLRVAVDVGDTVKAGQLLAEMDPVDLEERLTGQDAALQRATHTMATANAQHQDSVLRQQLAASNAQRYVDLGEKNFVSPGVVEGKLQEQASAEAGVNAAKANLAAAQADIRRLAAERAALKQLRDNVRLLAPADGVVTSREAEPGSTVVAGQAVVRVVDPASLWVKLRLDQGRSTGLAIGLRAEVVLRSNPRQPIPGQVARVEAVSDSVTEERVAMVGFDALASPTAGGPSIGELAEVTLTLARTAPTLVVSNASVKRQGGQSGVWRVREGKLEFAAVRLGQVDLDGQVQVLEGLQAGEAVVVHSESELGPKTRIQVVESLAGNTP